MPRVTKYSGAYVGMDSMVIDLVSQDRSEMFSALAKLLGYASLDAEELEAAELAEAINRAADIATRHMLEARV